MAAETFAAMGTMTARTLVPSHVGRLPRTNLEMADLDGEAHRGVERIFPRSFRCLAMARTRCDLGPTALDREGGPGV
ncbi:hypothetical protein Ais01nite_21630 [Asanoa ishikariensis]|uniref:Uncharacterized protein n=1 Tax=Asanoa ishikariensis TaxID=137265 RepID=A0A1H3U7I9_9ACTN|nr:hypothetical protein Ais01nite_21630 [Asanoa ishikariensis]SDZ58436.1 hypothetical protein SAMN05421684_6710 [Asanoa ishikariensis]